jgi:hypothetical protein
MLFEPMNRIAAINEIETLWHVDQGPFTRSQRRQLHLVYVVEEEERCHLPSSAHPTARQQRQL